MGSHYRYFENLVKRIFELSEGQSRLGCDPPPLPPMAELVDGLFTSPPTKFWNGALEWGYE
jgi:hypothetical protein